MTTRQETASSERFETAFNRIHKKLQQIAAPGSNDRFSFLVKEGSKKYAVIRKHADELQQFARLRNAMVHEKIDAYFYIAEPHLSVVERIEKIAASFQQPESALALASAPVAYFYEDTPLSRVLSTVQAHSYTQFPIYSRSGEYKWMLTSNHIINWMSHRLHGDIIHLESVLVRDLYTRKQKSAVAFASAFANIFEVEDCFEQHFRKGKKLEALLITVNGTQNEIPLGIITAWDLLQINQDD